MTDPLLERVAIAVHDARFWPGDEPTRFEQEHGRAQEYCRRIAQAALSTCNIEGVREALDFITMTVDRDDLSDGMKVIAIRMEIAKLAQGEGDGR